MVECSTTGVLCRGEVLEVETVAQSEVVRKGQNVIFMKATLINEDNVKLAVSNGTFFPFLADKAGYIKN